MENTIIKMFITINILISLLLLCSCESNNIDTFSDYTHSTEDTYETIEVVDGDDTNDTTTPDYPEFKGKEIAATFSHPEESYSYIYEATVTGKYRFDFDISNVNCNYTFLVTDEKEQILTETSYSEGGKLVHLYEGKKYVITIRQDEGVDFEGFITIGVPLKPQTITNNFASGTFRFEGETIEYKFKPSISGIYRFDFNIDDTNKNFDFIILEENESILEETSYDNTDNGCSVPLESERTYKIQVIEKTGLANFEIKINEPNPEFVVEEQTISGTIRYIDQSDCFLFIPEISGIYRFDFDTSDVTKNYNVKILDSKKTELKNNDYSDDGITVSLTKGEQYKIFVTYSQGYIDYIINIGMPIEPQNITFPFSGSIDYIDQNNVYYFSNKHDGDFIITFDIDNEKSNYLFQLYTSKNKLILNSDSSEEAEKVHLDSNETYRLEISQNTGLCNYTINLDEDNSKE